MPSPNNAMETERKCLAIRVKLLHGRLFVVGVVMACM